MIIEEGNESSNDFDPAPLIEAAEHFSSASDAACRVNDAGGNLLGAFGFEELSGDGDARDGTVTCGL
jgi:hypothetical protein